MKKFIRILSLLFAAVLVASLLGGCGAEKAEAVQQKIEGSAYAFDDSSGISVHDPTLFKAEDGTYYIYGTHMASAKSTDLINWKTVSNGVFDDNKTLVPNGSTVRETFAEPLSWCDGYLFQSGSKGVELQTNIWASAVFYNKAMQKYCYYACSSVWGTPVSVIWFAAGDHAEGPFEYRQCLVYSGFNKLKRLGQVKYPSHYRFTNLGTLIENGVFTREEVENAAWFNESGNYNCDLGAYPNCIDPAVFYDENGKLWMVYGSYSGGIYLMPLIEETGLPDYEYMRNTDGYDMYFGKQLTKTNDETNGTGEGPFVVYDSEAGYYYLYLTYGGLAALDGYNIRAYRSESPEGPYVDAAGNSALDMKSTGVCVNGNYRFSFENTAHLSGGHSSCFIDDNGKIFQAYHTRFNDGEGAFFMDEIHQMLRTENGWHAMLPLKYNGETAGKVSDSDIEKKYELVMFSGDMKQADDWSRVNDIIEPCITAAVENGKLIIQGRSENVSVELTGDYTFRFNFDGDAYYGVFCRGTNEAGEKLMTFSAVSDSNKTIWAVEAK